MPLNAPILILHWFESPPHPHPLPQMGARGHEWSRTAFHANGRTAGACVIALCALLGDFDNLWPVW